MAMVVVDRKPLRFIVALFPWSLMLAVNLSGR
jgi:hypothetical protein